jgi:hypothetical protein
MEIIPDGSRNIGPKTTPEYSRPDWSSRASCGGPGDPEEVRKRIELFVPDSPAITRLKLLEAAKLCAQCPAVIGCVLDVLGNRHSLKPVQIVHYGDPRKREVPIVALYDRAPGAGGLARAVGIDLEAIEGLTLHFESWKPIVKGRRNKYRPVKDPKTEP